MLHTLGNIIAGIVVLLTLLSLGLILASIGIINWLIELGTEDAD